MVIDRVRWWFGRAKPGGGTSCGSVCILVGGCQSILRFGQDSRIWGSRQSDSKNPPLGSRKPQKPGPLGGVGVGCGLLRFYDFIGP